MKYLKVFILSCLILGFLMGVTAPYFSSFPEPITGVAGDFVNIFIPLFIPLAMAFFIPARLVLGPLIDLTGLQNPIIIMSAQVMLTAGIFTLLVYWDDLRRKNKNIFERWNWFLAGIFAWPFSLCAGFLIFAIGLFMGLIEFGWFWRVVFILMGVALLLFPVIFWKRSKAFVVGWATVPLLFFIFIILPDLITAPVEKGWKTIEGIVLKSEIVDREAVWDAPSWLKVRIVYNYQPQERPYALTSSEYLSSVGRSDFDVYYKKGARIKIKYNPHNPAQSHIEGWGQE